MRGGVHGLYDPSHSDSTTIDWASAGGAANWGQYSVTCLICQKNGKDYKVGCFQWGYSTDANGNMGNFGAMPATDADINAWKSALDPGYLRDKYGGDYQ